MYHVLDIKDDILGFHAVRVTLHSMRELIDRCSVFLSEKLVDFIKKYRDFF